MATEKRLIYMEDAKAALLGWDTDPTDEEIEYTLDKLPEVDAVEVVRCKDCIHRGIEGRCPMYHVDEIEWDDDGYTEVDYVPHDYTIDE